MPRKLGQHVLINQAAIQKIIAELELKKGDTIVEIGPGEGALTLPLLEECEKRNCKLIAIEKDPILVESMKYKVSNGAKIICGDILKMLPNSFAEYLIPNTKYKLVGNIPYYITGKLLRILGELSKKPEIAIVTIQREVAERLAAKPPKMNLLAAAVQIWGKPQILGYLKPTDFFPPPKVESAIIKIVPEAKNVDLERFFRLLKAVFKQPRKTVLNNLSTGLGITKETALVTLKKLGLSGQERPQNLDLGTLEKLSTLFFVN